MKASIDLREVTVSSKSGDFNATSLAHVINTETVNRLVVQTWLEKAGESPSHSPCIGALPTFLGQTNSGSPPWSSASTLRTSVT